MKKKLWWWCVVKTSVSWWGLSATSYLWIWCVGFMKIANSGNAEAGVGQANDCNHWVDLYTATLTPACVLMCCRDQHSCSTTTTTSSRCRMLWPTWRSIPHSWSKAKGVICALFYVLEVIGKSDYDTGSLSSLIKKKGVCESRPSESYFLTFTFSLSWRMHCSKPQHCSTLTYSIQFFLLLLWTQFYQTELTTSVERQLFTLSNRCVDQ